MSNTGFQCKILVLKIETEEQMSESLMEKCTYYDAVKRYEHTKLLWIDLLTSYENKNQASATTPRIIKNI